MTNRKLLLVLLFCSALIQLFAELRYRGCSSVAQSTRQELFSVFLKNTGVTIAILPEDENTDETESVFNKQADIGGFCRDINASESSLYYQIAAYDAYVFYVHASNPVADLNKDDIQRIFSGQSVYWSRWGGSNLQVLPVFTSREGLDPESEAVLTTLFNSAEFNGKIRLFPTMSESIQFVAKNPQAITVASISFKNTQSVKIIAYEKLEPTWKNILTATYPLTYPIVFFHLDVPQGDALRFLDFVLSNEGQKILSKNYCPISLTLF